MLIPLPICYWLAGFFSIVFCKRQTYSRDASSYNELRGSAISRRNRADLNNDTDDHDGGTEEDGVSSTETVTKNESKQSTDEATDSVDGGNETLPCRVTVDLGEIRDKGRSRDDTGHDTLIITKEQEVGRR